MFIWLKNDLSGWRITLRNICQLWSRWKLSPSKHWDGLIQNSKKKAHPLHFIAFQLSPPWIFSSSGACCWSILGAGNQWNCISPFPDPGLLWSKCFLLLVYIKWSSKPQTMGFLITTAKIPTCRWVEHVGQVQQIANPKRATIGSVDFGKL